MIDLIRRQLAAGVVALALAGEARAADATVNVDFQPGPGGMAFSVDYFGQGALADPGHDHWNIVAPPVDGYESLWGSGGNFNFAGSHTSGTLQDSSGGMTPVVVSVREGVPLGTTFAVNPSNTWAYEHVANDKKRLMSDYLIAPGGGVNHVIISNLVAGARYTLYLYGAGDQETHRTTFTVGAAVKTTGGAPNRSHELTLDGDYVVFSDVEAVDGVITVAYVGAGPSRDGNFNGLQLRGEIPTFALPEGGE